MNEVTRILSAIEGGDPHGADQLLPLVYNELRELAAAKLARERPDLTFQATALVHEAYLRLVGTEDTARWDNRGHFFAAAAEAMRRILVENARRKRCQKHGGGLARQELEPDRLTAPEIREDLLALDEALPDQTGRRQPASRSVGPATLLWRAVDSRGGADPETVAALGGPPLGLRPRLAPSGSRGRRSGSRAVKKFRPWRDSVRNLALEDRARRRSARRTGIRYDRTTDLRANP